MKILPSSLRYLVFSGRFSDQDYIPEYDQVFDFWIKNWPAACAEMKIEKAAGPDDFFRQDRICAIFHENQVIGVHLYTIFDLRPRCAMEHSYLKNSFTPGYLSTCRSMGFAKGMSMENLYVDPAFRKSQTGIRFADVLISLGQKVFVEKTDAEIILAPARVENMVSRSACGLGFEVIQPGIRCNNVLLDLLICRREKVKPAGSEIQFLVDYLWKNHIDATAEMARMRAA